MLACMHAAGVYVCLHICMHAHAQTLSLSLCTYASACLRARGGGRPNARNSPGPYVSITALTGPTGCWYGARCEGGAVTGASPRVRPCHVHVCVGADMGVCGGGGGLSRHCRRGRTFHGRRNGFCGSCLGIGLAAASLVGKLPLHLICVYTCAYICKYNVIESERSTYTSLSVYMYMSVYIYIYIDIYVYIYKYVYMYICIYHIFDVHVLDSIGIHAYMHARGNLDACMHTYTPARSGATPLPVVHSPV